ncbi:acyl-CoA N-acyltransferase [Xylariales sp. AK1849]|nr:acyl-CoA N-acyltransferase [Xylariales sp. AK1849]
MATIRRFRPEDLSRLSLCQMDPLTETYDMSFYLQYYSKWPEMFMVAEDGKGNIIGYIMGKLESSPDYFKYSKHYLPWHAHITALTVAPAHRRSGLGSILTEHFEAAADVGNAYFTDLFVRKSNTRAINFYKRMGYSVYRVVRDYYGDNVNDPTATGEDAFDMRKSMKRDVKREHVRDDGEKHEVDPEDVF